MAKTETRKDEIRFKTNDPKRMLGKFIVRNVSKTWKEAMFDSKTGEQITVERTDRLFDKGTYIDEKVLESIRFYLLDGSLTEIEVSNQKRLAMIDRNTSFFPFRAVVRAKTTKNTFLLYATSVSNAVTVLTDYIELNYDGSFFIHEVKVLDYCVILVDNLRSYPQHQYDLDIAYLNKEITMEEFVEATCDAISNDNPDDVDEEATFHEYSASRRKKNKYGARKTGGHASRKEHVRAGQLRIKERAGMISNLREQVSFTLIPSQRDSDGNLLEHSCRYIADFVYNDSEGNQVVEDTKGYRTPEYIIKRKLMLMVYGIRIIEI